MKHKLPNLPYPIDALEPIISAETLEYHHGKHHKAYVDKLNELVQGTEFENSTLEEIILKSSGPVFNNAAQVWNHTFYWGCLTPQFREPQGPLLNALEKDFGSFENFEEKFQKAAIGQFGSGWAWLVQNPADGKLSIETTSNADNPLTKNKKPLLTADVWEHAYYIDYRNERPRYLKSIFKVINWSFVENNFQGKSSSPAKEPATMNLR